MNQARTTIALLVATGLVGCAQMPNLGQRNDDVSMKSVKDEYDQIQKSVIDRAPSVNQRNGNYVSQEAVNYVPSSGEVTLNAQSAPIGPLLQEVAGDFSVSFADSADAMHSVTVQIKQQTRSQAVRSLAAAAGYAAVIKEQQRQIIIAPKATYVFELPKTYLNAPPANYSVGGNTAAGGGSQGGGGSGGGGGLGGGGGSGGGLGSGGSGGSGGGGGQQLTASFQVNGQSKPTTAAELQATLEKVAGEEASVVIDASTGLASVTGTGANLERAENFIRSYSDTANTRVSVHAAILQVSLSGSFRAGVNWSAILDVTSDATLSLVAPNGAPPLSQNNAPGSGSSTQDTSQIAYTEESVSAVIEALSANTDVRVVSQPRLVAGDNTPATLFSGTQLPYVGSVESNIAGISGATSSGASLSYVLDGLSLSFIPDVMSNQWVNMQLIPALSDVERFDQFDVNGTQLTGPRQALRQVYLQIVAPTNRTVILAGSQETNGVQDTTSTPLLNKIPVLGNAFKGLSRSKTTSQLVILLRTHVIAPPRIDPLVSQSI